MPMMSTPAAGSQLPPPYAGDAFAYSLPGGFAKAQPWGASARAPGVTADSALPEGARTLVVTDAACDLPLYWLANHKVLLLPLRIRFGSRTRADAGDTSAARDFFERHLPGIGRDAQALALSAAGTQDFVEPHLAAHIDHVLEIAQASTRGSGYMNSLVAAQNLMLQHGRMRRQHGTQRPFKMWVIDAATALSGQGVLVAEAVRAVHEGLNTPRTVQHVDGLRRRIHTLAVPGDVAHWYRHNRAETEAAMGWLSYGVGKMLDRTPVVDIAGNAMNLLGNLKSHDAAIERALAVASANVRAGLAVPVACVSHAGDVAQLRALAEFVDFEAACARHGVTLHVATMSLTNALSLGRGGLSIAFASDRFEG